jgi:hypothetical protein
VFGMVRRRSHGMMARQEFEQGVEHFRAAATHAARGTGAAVGPRIVLARGSVLPAAGKMRDAASNSWGSAIAMLAPLAAAATEGARQAGRKPSKADQKNAKTLDKKARKAMGAKQSSGKGKLIGLGVAGLALGAAGAMVLRRRQQQQWDEYDPSQPIGAVGSESMPSAMSPDPTASPRHNPTVAEVARGENPS